MVPQLPWVSRFPGHRFNSCEQCQDEPSAFQPLNGTMDINEFNVPRRWGSIPVPWAWGYPLTDHCGGGVLPSIAHLLFHVPLPGVTRPCPKDVHTLLHLGPGGNSNWERFARLIQDWDLSPAQAETSQQSTFKVSIKCTSQESDTMNETYGNSTFFWTGLELGVKLNL